MHVIRHDHGSDEVDAHTVIMQTVFKSQVACDVGQ